MNLWQSAVWQKVLKSTLQVEKVIEHNGIFIQKRSLWLWQFWLFICGIDTKKVLDEQELIQICEQEKALFIQVETLSYSWESFHDLWGKFKPWYFKKFITPYTATIDLQQTDAEILANMKPKWRYNIKLAYKKWVICKIVKKSDKNIKVFTQLMQETTTRDWFSWHDYMYYKTFLHTLDESELILAYLDDQIIAGWIYVFRTDVSYYYYGASSSDKQYRNLMAPYAVQWTAIQHAQSLGSKLYDFLWVAWEWEDYDASLAWVTDFKKKFWPEILKVSKSVMYINNLLKYKMFCFFKNINKKLR